MKVFKFGGVSIKDAEAIKNVFKIIKNETGNLVVVVSAMGKSTDLLEMLIKTYFENNSDKKNLFNEFKEYHLQIIEDLFGRKEMPQEVYSLFSKLENKLNTPPSVDYNFEYDQIICFGELISTHIISDFFNSLGQSNKCIDIRTCLKTDTTFRNAKVDWHWTETRIKKEIDFNDTNLYITQGFIGSTNKNLTTTLGREGSDFSAAIIGSSLLAENVTIWKDVPGILNADPKKMVNTVMIKELSYKEAVELTHSGAKVIHPKTMKPLHNKGIPLFVKSFIDPKGEGTVIHKIGHKIELPPIYTLKENQMLITLSTNDFSIISINDIERVVNFMVKNLIKVTLLQQSAIDLNIVTNASKKNKETIFEELSKYYKIRYNTGLTLVTIRHYTEEVIDWMVKEKKIYLEQHSRLTARMLVKDNF